MGFEAVRKRSVRLVSRKGDAAVIHVRIINHEELAVSQGGVLGFVGRGLGALGLMDLKATVEKKVAEELRAQFEQRGMKAEVIVVLE
jgi:hypothetical protein